MTFTEVPGEGGREGSFWPLPCRPSHPSIHPSKCMGERVTNRDHAGRARVGRAGRMPRKRQSLTWATLRSPFRVKGVFNPCIPDLASSLQSAGHSH